LLGQYPLRANRGIVSLKLPETTRESQANGKQIFIKSVVEERVFEENSKTHVSRLKGSKGLQLQLPT
jgi:hypothetical protein